MKALILVGGFGTRLRPLTLSKAKPLVEFCNRSILEHQVAALAKVGVKDIILAVSYRPDDMQQALTDLQAAYGVRIVIKVEPEPMGTAGPLAFARDELSDTDYFFVFNSDVTCEYPLKELLGFHRSHGKEGTIMVTRVDEPSKYGVVVHDHDGKIQHFVEKPQTFVGNHINAGIYCFTPTILNRIQLRPTSIEKEIFPVMADEGQLYAMVLPGYWMDIGQPKDFLIGTTLHLNSLRTHHPEMLASGPGIKGNVLIHESAVIRDPESVLLGPNVVVGPGCIIEPGVRLSGSTILAGTRIQAYAMVKNSIVGWRSVIGKWARVENGSVLAEDVTVKDEAGVNGALVLPHKTINESIYTPGTIVM